MHISHQYKFIFLSKWKCASESVRSALTPLYRYIQHSRISLLSPYQCTDIEKSILINRAGFGVTIFAIRGKCLFLFMEDRPDVTKSKVNPLSCYFRYGGTEKK